MKRIILFVICAILVATNATARDAGRDLRKLVGYTIIASASVSDVLKSRSGDKFLKLDNGYTFKVQFLLLDPLLYTDVIVFAKPFPADMVEKYKGKVPDIMLYSIKLLIDNEIYDAEPTAK